MCPRCGANVLLVRQVEGFEKFMVGITGKRSYRCRMCENTFRARDKRNRQRIAARPAAASHGEQSR
jgi:DNA-directed RNA polymerase subunit RPC12/RpoP